jgi:hypothetical protein
MIYELIHGHPNAQNIAEGYTIYKGKGEDQVGSKVPSARVLGVIEAYTYLLDRPLIIWPASMIQRTEIPAHHAPLILSGKDREHAKDAYKHARHWFIRDKHVGSR